jgi:hypothetical protein
MMKPVHYYAEIGEVVTLSTGGQIVIYQVIVYEGDGSDLKYPPEEGKRPIFIEIQMWNPTEPSAPGITTSWLEADYGENVVWFHGLNEDEFIGGENAQDPKYLGQTIRGWREAQVPDDADLHAIYLDNMWVSGDLVIWLLEPGTY